MSKSAMEVALEAAAKRRQDEARRRESEREEGRAHQRRRAQLERHVDLTLSGFERLGLRRQGGSLLKDGRTVATVVVRWETWEFQGSDESPVVDCAGWAIAWKVGDGQESSSSDEGGFDERFGEEMGSHV